MPAVAASRQDTLVCLSAGAAVVWGLQQVYSISAGAATTPPIKFQNVKGIHRVVVLKSLLNSTHLANSLKFKLWSYGHFNFAPESIGTCTIPSTVL